MALPQPPRAGSWWLPASPNRNRTLAPPSRPRSRWTVPPVASAAARAMSRPSPVDPPPLLPRCNAEDGSATPVPPSSTTSVTHPLCRTTDTPTGAAGGVCRKTFSSNVSTTAPSASVASGTQQGSATSISHIPP
ncbi:hypothetical protein DFR72_11381 [Lentzea flaviverrucosa]|uniref:Uncharacterized protein n=1 Tax=Lentzea flaviverrucosa TaxID=200379 RepID=A0A1H9XDX3_9PSEU|nr:hypothetical protein [Lentzea flaviverrucosa]RDI21537.1 hypothetical protein DFR72_11381 [Lentzea flaviverrucosa]SES44345.1 hypothetical protein SAMN05216195_114198 [Lentzea flaviverrucosa]